MSLLRIALLFVLLGASTSAKQADETPRKFAKRFCRVIQKLNVRGIPCGRDREILSVYLSEELLRLFAVTDQQYEAFERKHANEDPPLKPPWCAEGDWFFGTEGIPTYSINNANRINGRVAVVVVVNDRLGASRKDPVDKGTIYKTAYILILDRSKDGWVVSNIIPKDREGDGFLKNIQDGIKEYDLEAETDRKP